MAAFLVIVVVVLGFVLVVVALLEFVVVVVVDFVSDLVKKLSLGQ